MRTALHALVDRWDRGEIGPADVQRAASDLSRDWQDWPWDSSSRPDERDPRLIVAEVLSALEDLDLQLIVAEDITAIRALLSAGSGEEQVAWRRWRDHWRGIDFRQRQRNLRGDPFYHQ